MKPIHRNHDAQRSFTLSRRACASWLVGLAATLAIACASCTSYTVLTPADLQQRGTRSFSGATRQAAVDASATALESIGYKVTQRSADTGIVKTAPQEIFSEATTETDLQRSALLHRVEGAKSTTTVQRDSLAWTLRITPSGDGVTIVATPRAYRNGNEVDDPEAFVAEVMDPKFAALWREVGDSMGAATKAGP